MPPTIIDPRCEPRTWIEAEVIAEPRSEKDLAEPVVLVRRRKPLVLGPNGEELCYFDGHPAISLFTGAGGFDIGIEQAGFCTLCQVEWDNAACQTLVANRPNFFRHSALIQGDIRKVPTSMILKEAGLRVGECHLLVGGPPCQGFSTSGKRQADDIRNTLVFEYLRVVREAQPKFFLMENVPGFTSLAKGAFLRDFLGMAYGAYYELVYGLLDAVEYGVPQYRCRFVCMGTRRDLVECDGTLGSLPRPANFHQADIDELAQLDRGTLFRGEFSERRDLLTHPPGIRYFPDRPVLVPPAPIGNRNDDGAKCRSETFMKFYGRLRREEPDRLVACPVGDDD